MNANVSTGVTLSDESDDELTTVYREERDRPDRVTVCRDEDYQLPRADVELDEDEIDRAREDVAYVNDLLNGEEPEEDELVADGGMTVEGDVEDAGGDDDIEHFDDITSTDEANQAAIEQGMAIRIQPPAPKATTFYFVEGDSWKRQLAGQKVSTGVRFEHVRATVKSAIQENDQSGGGGAKAVSPETVETCPEPSKTLDDYVEIAEILASDDAPSESERFSDGRITIEDHGQWGWSLYVFPDGSVRAIKGVKYSGTVTYSTHDRYSKPSKRSQYGLSVETIVERYIRHSDTELTEQELRVRINEARAEVQR